MNYRLRLKAFGITTALLAALSVGQVFGAKYVRLTILHTNDTHSHLLPFSYPASLEVANDGPAQHITLKEYRNIGGIARRATLIKQLEAEHSPVLVMDAGDLIDGSPFSVEFAGEAEFAAAGAAGYEVVVTGNHEYSNTYDNFTKRLDEARFPVLGANVYKKDGTLLLTPYVIKNEDGMRIAILGLVTPNTYTAVKEGGLEIKDPIEVAKVMVPKLREQADAVILLTHIGYDEDRLLAEKVPGIDAIIGGHSHTRLEHPALVAHTPDDDPFTLDGTVIAQDFQWGGDLGEVDLTFRQGDKGWTLMSYDGKLIPITKDIPEDPAVRAIVEKYHKKIATKYDVVIGNAEADFIGEAPANMVSDAMRDATGADFTVQNYGGVRTDLVEGPLTMGDITMLFPFNNTVVTFEATGAQLKDILLHGGRPAVSNIVYRVADGKLVFAEIGGKPIDDSTLYKGVTHSFFAETSIPKDIKVVDIRTNAREAIISYLKAKQTIAPDSARRADF